MSPLRVRATNYRTFDELDLDLPAGCVAVIGENGAGKSSVVNLIDLALFGAESRSLADCLTDSGDATELSLELTFEHGGVHYRVRRSYSARGRGRTSVDLERQTDAGWDPLTCESAKETDTLICQTIGLTRSTFRASAYLAQGDGAAFTDAPAARRKEILADVLGLDVWASLQDLAKRDRRVALDRLQRVTGETEQATALVATKGLTEEEHHQLQAVAAETQAALAQAETRIGELEQEYRAAAETAGKRKVVEAQFEAARSELGRLRTGALAADEAEAAIKAARQELAVLPAASSTDGLVQRERELLDAISTHNEECRAHDAAVEEARRLERQRNDLHDRAARERAEFDRIRHAISDLEATPQDEAHCDRCGQVLAGSARAAAIESMGKDANTHAAAADALLAEAQQLAAPEPPPRPPDSLAQELNRELETVRAQLALAQQQVQQQARLEERINQLQHAIALRPATDTVAAANENEARLAGDLAALEPVDLDAITRQGETARRHLADLRARRETQVAGLAGIAARLDAIRDAEQRLTEAAAATRDLQTEINLCLLLEAAYGRDGIPALILENSAIPYIETESARILAELGGKTAGARIELHTQRALKSGDGLRDALDIVVTTQDGREREYANWSGGEKTRLNIALRAALAKLLKTNRGADCSLFVIDEPDGLDEKGKSALVAILRDMQTEGVDRVYLISHDPELRDSFDETIRVVADSDVASHLEYDGAPERDAVAV